MKLNGINYPAFVFGPLLALSGAAIHAGTMGPAQIAATEKVYFSFFGGGGASNKLNISQYGTAFITEQNGGPLAVNAFGLTNS